LLSRYPTHDVISTDLYKIIAIKNLVNAHVS